MGIDQELARLAVPGQMDLEDTLRRDSREVLQGIEAVVVRAHEDVDYVEEDSAVGALRNARHELPLRHRVRGIRKVGGYIFQCEPAPEVILDSPHAVGHVAQRRLGEGKRYKVVEIATVDARPAQVVRDDGGLETLGESFELSEVVLV